MRLIDKDALKVELDAWARIIRNPDYYMRADALHIIDTAPEIDAVPVVRGEWKPIFKGADTCECSVCKSKGFSDSDFGFIATPYCPNCGAEMEVEP